MAIFFMFISFRAFSMSRPLRFVLGRGSGLSILNTVPAIGDEDQPGTG